MYEIEVNFLQSLWVFLTSLLRSKEVYFWGTGLLLIDCCGLWERLADIAQGEITGERLCEIWDIGYGIFCWIFKLKPCLIFSLSLKPASEKKEHKHCCIHKSRAGIRCPAPEFTTMAYFKGLKKVSLAVRGVVLLSFGFHLRVPNRNHRIFKESRRLRENQHTSLGLLRRFRVLSYGIHQETKR